MSNSDNLFFPHTTSILRDADNQNRQLKVNEDGSLNVANIPSLINSRLPVDLDDHREITNSSSNTPLDAGQTFTGIATDVHNYGSVVLAVKTDQAGSLYCDFSVDGTNWDSTLTFSVAANLNEVHRITVTRKYFRVRFINTSAVNQTFFRLQCLGGQQTLLSSPLNSTIQNDADSVVVRPLDFNLMTAEGLYQNRTNTIKDGINDTINTNTTPEDAITWGGVYTGFPTGAVEAGQIVVAGADTGTVYYSYLASSASTEYTFASKAIAGAGTYALGHNIWRCNYAYFVSSNVTAFNAGDITIRNATTTSNVFVVIPAGYSQSYCAAYTVPAGSSAYIDRITASMRGNATGALDGFFWYRHNGESPRLRFPFELVYGSMYFDDVDYLIKIPALTDICPRIVYCSTNGLAVKISYRIIKVVE